MYLYSVFQPLSVLGCGISLDLLLFLLCELPELELELELEVCDPPELVLFDPPDSVFGAGGVARAIAVLTSLFCCAV